MSKQFYLNLIKKISNGMKERTNLILILVISLIIILARLIPHAPNFSPLASVILFTGVYAQKKKYFIWPLIALFISDFFLGFYETSLMLAVYGTLAANLFIGQILKTHKNLVNLLSASLLSALLFFLITNFVVWIASDWYQNNLSGLLLSYNLAIPFFRNTLSSNLIYTLLLFGVYESVAYWLKEKSINKEEKIN
jgi:Zn-dependent protease with chaperone function